MATDIIHKSKINYGILAFVVIVLGTTTAIVIINFTWTGVITCGLVALFIGHIYTGTFYKITADHWLIIKCGIVETWEIEIKDIVSVKKSNSVLSSPALSTDRLEINYQGGCVLVSPKDQKKFIDDLRKVNPKI